jgi:hypothetical protein
MVRAAAHCDPVPLGVGEELQQPGRIVGRRGNLNTLFLWLYRRTGESSSTRVLKIAALLRLLVINQQRLQRYVGVRREFGSLVSGGSVLFALADLF